MAIAKPSTTPPAIGRQHAKRIAAAEITLTFDAPIFGHIALTFRRSPAVLKFIRWPEVNAPDGTPAHDLSAVRAGDGTDVPRKVCEIAAHIAEGVEAWGARDFGAADRAFARAGATPEGPRFYRACWQACREIRAGEVITYGELAERAGGDPRRHARPAGQAMRNNPWPLIIPCHRVIGSACDLHGYGGATDVDGSQLTTKRDLLVHEGMEVNAQGRVIRN